MQEMDILIQYKNYENNKKLLKSEEKLWTKHKLLNWCKAVG